MENEPKTVSVMGFKVFSDDLAKIPISERPCKVVNCSISPNNYGLSTKDPEFKEVLKNTDYLVLDGVYFALAGVFLKGKNIKRNQGPDVFAHFIKRVNDEHGKVFFLGSSEEVLSKIKARAAQEYTNVEVETYSPPFKPEFTEEDNRLMIDSINRFRPDVVFVGMTAPKQEKWAVKHKGALDAGLAISIGNVFDWYAGTQKRIHPFFFKIRMGWLVRIFLRPEIFRRNIGNQMLFFWHLGLITLKLKKQPQ
ncbi:MAG: WecB/TagA/CpsF family glycosyltransferase [Chitinophagaceae bacterium]|nr:WecB/TagA/CpsF family glycosyltransferase [Chitinophagaceae bacterium]MCZ2397686.1 WecB/TagA/CpsF family glycosyltransferase [Chitinophagales bacterium]